MPRTALLPVSLLMVLFATGCRPAVPASPVSSLPRSATGSESAQPAVPADFPVMPGASLASGADSNPVLIATWTTDADGPRVYDFYIAALPAAGFSIVGLYPGGSVAIIRLRHGSDPILKLVITRASPSSGTEMELRVDGP
jgi:hypothetical protein